MIKYNNNTINDWFYSTDNIIKVYRNNAICYYKISGGGDTPTAQTPCFAVVDDITLYSDTEFEDVFNKADEKWYKLNNLNQYEEYGVYASGRTSCGTVSFTELTDIIAQSTTAMTNHVITISPQVGTFSKIRINTTKKASSTSYNWIVFKQTETGSEVMAFNMYDFGAMNGLGSGKNYVTDADGSQTFANWVDANHTIVEIDIAKLTNNQVSELWLLGYQENVNPAAASFYMQSTDCVTTYEGKLTIDDGYEYIYSGGSWVNLGEVSGSTATLPDIPFVLNYNAKNYDATTHSIPMTSGQLNDTDAVAYRNPNNIVDHSADGYITISNSSMRIRKQGQDISLFNRTSNSTSSDLTIVCKAKSTSGENIITNRDSNYNWMYRLKTSGSLRFHGTSETGSIAWNTSNPDIMSVRTYYDSGTKLKYNNWTQNTSTSPVSFSYGSTNTDGSSAGALFVGYSWTSTNEQWGGDFYWVYMAQANLTDAQIQEVIDYNEGGGGQYEYPIYYDVMQDPPNNLVFSSIIEAEEYECPWVGMSATIDGDKYIFSGDSTSGYEWVYQTSRLPDGYTEVEYIENAYPNKAYIDTGFKPNQNTRVIADLQYVRTNTHPRAFGCGSWNSVGYIFNAENGIPGEWRWKFGANGNNWLTTGVNSDLNRHKVEINNGSLYLDDVVIGSTTVTTFQLTDNIGLFCFIQGGSQGGSSSGEYMFGKFYSFKIYDNGTLVRDFVSCTRDSDSKAGMYDIVNDVFYSSANSDDFTAGNPV